MSVQDQITSDIKEAMKAMLNGLTFGKKQCYKNFKVTILDVQSKKRAL